MNTIVRIVIAVVSFALCSPQSGDAQGAPAKAYEDKAAYEVYSAILGRPCEMTSGGMDWENWGCDVRGAKPLLIRGDTVRRSRNMVNSQCRLESSDRAIQLAIGNWKSINETTWLLNDDFTLPTPHGFISAGELDEIFERTSKFCKQSLVTPDKVGCSWEKFTEKYPEHLHESPATHPAAGVAHVHHRHVLLRVEAHC